LVNPPFKDAIIFELPNPLQFFFCMTTQKVS
jgi:hypothetical protein